MNSKLSKILLITFFISLFFVPKTNSYFNDREKSKANILSAVTLDLKLEKTSVGKPVCDGGDDEDRISQDSEDDKDRNSDVDNEEAEENSYEKKEKDRNDKEKKNHQSRKDESEEEEDYEGKRHDESEDDKSDDSCEEDEGERDDENESSDKSNDSENEEDNKHDSDDNKKCTEEDNCRGLFSASYTFKLKNNGLMSFDYSIEAVDISDVCKEAQVFVFKKNGPLISVIYSGFLKDLEIGESDIDNLELSPEQHQEFILKIVSKKAETCSGRILINSWINGFDILSSFSDTEAFDL